MNWLIKNVIDPLNELFWGQGATDWKNSKKAFRILSIIFAFLIALLIASL